MTIPPKAVLITGGGTGIGAACAHRFHREKYRVAVVGRRAPAIEAVANEVGGMAFAADAADSRRMGRLGEGSDIAGAMVFLASDAASYVTGRTIVVDGGALLPECGSATR